MRVCAFIYFATLFVVHVLISNAHLDAQFSHLRSTDRIHFSWYLQLSHRLPEKYIGDHNLVIIFCGHKSRCWVAHGIVPVLTENIGLSHIESGDKQEFLSFPSSYFSKSGWMERWRNWNMPLSLLTVVCTKNEVRKYLLDETVWFQGTSFHVQVIGK